MKLSETNSEVEFPDLQGQLDFDAKIAAVKVAPSDALAAQVVLYKTLAIGKEVAIACMEELFLRKENGDLFDFEGFIEQEVKRVPKVEPLDMGYLNGLFSSNAIMSFLKK